MLKTHVCGPVVLMLCMLSDFTDAIAQEDALVPSLGAELMSIGPNFPPMPVTPMAVERGDVQPERVRVYHVLPLRWALEKYRIYRTSTEEEIARIAEDLEQTLSEQQQVIDELTAYRITSLQQLDETTLVLQQAMLESAVVDAELAALREAVERRSRSLGQGREKTAEAIELQKKLVELVEAKRQMVAGLRERGATPPGELAEVDGEVL